MHLNINNLQTEIKVATGLLKENVPRIIRKNLKQERLLLLLFFLQEIMITCNLLSDLVGQLELVPTDEKIEVSAVI